MTRHILLDSQPLGLLTHPTPDPHIVRWAAACRAAGHELYIPEVIDYELRRELLRASKTVGLSNLDAVKSALTYLPLTTSAMLAAADLWAQARRGGFSTGDPKKLDIDVILAAQALTLGVAMNVLVVATGNVNHLARFVPADMWTNIIP